jgi:hypothetical protein
MATTKPPTNMTLGFRRRGIEATRSPATAVLAAAGRQAAVNGTGGDVLLFGSNFETGDMSEWPGAGQGGVTVVSDSQSYRGGFHATATISTNSDNSFGDYRDYGTAGNLSTQIRNFVAQIAVCWDDWEIPAADEQKIFIFQFYDSTWASGSFSNANRKYQLILSVGGRESAYPGQFLVNLLCWNNTTDGLLNKTAWLVPSVVRTPISGAWHHLRLECQLDTNGSGALGHGNGNGILRLWHCGTLIAESTSCNIVDGNTNVGIGRLLLTSAIGDGVWGGPNSTMRWDDFQIATGPTALTSMPSGITKRGTLLREVTMSTIPSGDPNEPPVLLTGQRYDGGNVARSTLPSAYNNPNVVGFAGLSALTQSQRMHIGFSIRFGSNYDAPVAGIGGTQKPVLLHRANELSAQRLIWQQRNAGGGASASSIRWLYWDNGVETAYNDMTGGLLTVSSVNTATGAITFTGNHYRQTGDRITPMGSTGTAIGGITTGRDYCVIRDSATTLRLAKTFWLARAGINVAIPTAGSGTRTFRRMDSFPLTGNLGKWFWVELHADITQGVIRKYITAIDSLCSFPVPTGEDQWQMSGGVPVWTSASCVRRLVTERPILYTDSTFTYIDMGYYDGYVNALCNANSFFDVGEFKFGTTPAQIVAPTSFPQAA